MTGLDGCRWGLAALFACCGLWITLLNYFCILAWFLRRRHHSWIPLLGSGFIALALFVCPVTVFTRYAWFLPLLDPGCLLTLIAPLHIYWLLRRTSPS